MKQIALTNSTRFALLDDDDAVKWGGLLWKMSKDRKGNSYAVTRLGGRYKSMHRLVMGEPHGLVVDHRDGDGLNCQKDNLRAGTQSQNMGNAKKHTDAKIKSKGVSLDKATGKYRAAICIQGQRIRIGRFDTEAEAAAAYDRHAKTFFGDFARTNKP